MGASSSSSKRDKFIKLGEERIGEEEKTSHSVGIYKLRFLQTTVIDRIIVQLRIEVTVDSMIWTILRSLEDFRQLEKSLELPENFSLSFPKTDQRFFQENSEIMTVQKEICEWFLAAAEVCIYQTPILSFLGVMNDQTEIASTKIDLGTLCNTCDSGDILLFKTHGLIPSSIRKFTGSKYDHIGVVIVEVLDGGGREVSFLEASGDQWGVHMHNLRNRLLQWYLADASISYRRLCCKRDDRFRKLTKSFVDVVQGCKYGISFKSFMLNKKDKDPKEKHRFFCSELVTAYYKHLGIISRVAKSHNYMPGDFAEKESGSGLNLLGVAILEHEVMLTTWPRRQKIEKTPRRHSHHDCLRSERLSAIHKKKEQIESRRLSLDEPTTSGKVNNKGKLLTAQLKDNYWEYSPDAKRDLCKSFPII